MSRALNVTLRQLRVFIEVARLQSFSRAGDEIGLTQSAVSRCVRELEGEIGLKLVDRTTREVQLTDVGANLVGSVSRLLSDLDEALREIRDLGQRTVGLPFVEPSTACRWRRVAARQLRPALACGQDPQHGIDNSACFHARTAAPFTACRFCAKQGLNQRPLVIS